MLLVLVRILLLMKNPPTPLKGGYKPFYTRHNSVFGFNPPLGGQGGKNKGTLHATSLQITIIFLLNSKNFYRYFLSSSGTSKYLS